MLKALFFVSFCLGFGSLAQGASLDVTSGSARYPVGPHLVYLEDTTGTLTFAEVRSEALAARWQPYGQGKFPSFGLSSSVFWFRFDLSSSGSQDNWWLYLGRPAYFLDFSLFSKGSLGEWQEQRINGGIAPRPVAMRGDAFPLGRFEGDGNVFFARAFSDSSAFFPLEVVSDRGLDAIVKARSLAVGMLIGLFLGLILYNFFLWFGLRDTTYLYYIAYASCVFIYYLVIDGIIFDYVLPNHPVLARRVTLAFGGLGSFFIMLFSLKFLAFSESRGWVKQGVRIAAALCLSVFVLAPFAQFPLLNSLFSLSAMIGLVAATVAGVAAWRMGFRPAVYFLIAWSCFLIGGASFALLYRGVLHYTPLTFFGMQIGSSAEATLLSLALAHRIRLLRENQDRYFSLSITDALTGLFNVRYFWQELDQLVLKSRILQQPLSILMLDLDDFKRFNDSYGHQVGDRLLTTFGEILRAAVRGSDTPCRYGGEEFVVILAKTDLAQGMVVAERIQRAMERQEHEVGSGARVRVTCSLGLAELVPGEEAKKMVERADSALYEAKRQGKNRVVRATERVLTV